MHLNEPQQREEHRKEVRVKIPIRYHVRLHTMKVLTGKHISDAVTEALDAYFQRMASESSSPVPSTEGSA